VRVGVGYDSHRFEAGRSLILGGVRIPAERGLAGHSDADALAHAITDALLGAAGLGDLGTHFPPTAAKWAGADSLGLLAAALLMLEERNYQVVNIDATVVCEPVRLAPHASAMRDRLAEIVGISPAHVSVKVKSNEGMGWVGRGEGIAVVAVALIDAIE